MSAPLELWTWPTPNGRKVTVMLEECGLDYDVHPVNIREGEQLRPEFLALNPNNRIPVIRDHDGPGGPFTLWESGAILLYLAERTGRFLPSEPRARWTAIQWLMFQMGGVGPMHGQANHFVAYVAEPNPCGRDRYRKEARRLYRVCDERLARSEWIGGDAYGVADMAVWPWTLQMERIELDPAEFPNIARWSAAVAARPGVQRGMAVLADRASAPRMTDAERHFMFGDAQFERSA